MLKTQKVEIVDKSLCWVWNGNESKEKLISLLQENFGKMLVRVLFWFPENPNVLVLKAIGNFGTTRVEVLRVFVTSKLWYKASALLIPTNFVKKFEAAMVKFLWIGKLEKFKNGEIKNPVWSGGLNLPCIISRADSLFLSQK